MTYLTYTDNVTAVTNIKQWNILFIYKYFLFTLEHFVYTI